MNAGGCGIRPLAAGPADLRRLAHSDPEAFPVLFDSAALGPLGRYSILAAYPDAALRQDALGRLRGSDLPLPFLGGWVVYLGYELAGEIEPLPALPGASPRDPAPQAFALRVPAALIYDHVAGQAWIVAEPGRESLTRRLEQALSAAVGLQSPPSAAQWDPAMLRLEEEDPMRFGSCVDAALEHICAGDLYQANLSCRWRAPCNARLEPGRLRQAGGRLFDGLSPIDVLRAVFPGGSITGCPKFRCMQIIAALEDEARGAYTGALGYINRDGSLDFNILIRTITMDAEALEFRAGAGIVADSQWQLELQEMRAKARGLIAALQQA